MSPLYCIPHAIARRDVVLVSYTRTRRIYTNKRYYSRKYVFTRVPTYTSLTIHTSTYLLNVPTLSQSSPIYSEYAFDCFVFVNIAIVSCTHITAVYTLQYILAHESIFLPLYSSPAIEPVTFSQMLS